MKTIFVVLSVLFVSNAYAGTVTCTTVGNVTTCVETSSPWEECSQTSKGCF